MVLLSQRKVYVPLPPEGAEPVIVAGVEPAQICAGVLNVLDAITGLTVISIAADVFVAQSPEFTKRLYQVVVVNAPGLYVAPLLIPLAVAKPLDALVVLLCQV